MRQFTAESLVHDPNDSKIETHSSNLADKMLITFILATATNLPPVPHSTLKRNKL